MVIITIFKFSFWFYLKILIQNPQQKQQQELILIIGWLCATSPDLTHCSHFIGGKQRPKDIVTCLRSSN